MDQPTITLAQITLAATNLEAMAAFYNAVFAADLRPVPAHGTTMYRGALHGAVLLLCPNSLAGVDAAQNRHQFAYAVSDLAAILERAAAAGGVLDGEPQRQPGQLSATVIDPDGNTIVFAQPAG
ncbi:MAG TPA: VOC family protein [Herpetosiphonaceae bacterium]|nr:VOC family protein [Herpetosiphonaceae bacterium]